jgi:hypothetical protein
VNSTATAALCSVNVCEAVTTFHNGQVLFIAQSTATCESNMMYMVLDHVVGLDHTEDLRFEDPGAVRYDTVFLRQCFRMFQNNVLPSP